MQIGAYDIQETLGVGGTGRVYRAVRRNTGTQVALKLGRQIAVEVRALVRIDHPHVLRILDAGSHEGAPYLVTEIADGTLASRPPENWNALRRMLVQSLTGLAWVHALGLLHRDVKPSNILLCHGVWRLGDFGMVRSEVSHGTPGYAPPDAADQQGPWTDLFPLGLVARELSGGMLIPAGFQAWVDQMLAPVGRRFERAIDARLALEGVSGEPSRTPSTPSIQGETRPTSELPAAVTSPWAPPAPHPIPEDWRMPRLSGSPDRFSGVWTYPPARFVGRTAERDELWSRLQRLQRKVETVRIGGPSGTGKSRLAVWMTRAAHAAGAEVLRGRTRADLVRSRVAADGSMPTHLERLGLAVDDGPALERIIAGAAPLRSELRWLRALTVRRPLVVFLDDVHENPSMEPWLQWIGTLALPVLVLATQRAPGDLPIRALTLDDAQRLLTESVGLERGLAARVADHTGCSPLHAVHLVRVWHRRDRLRVTPEGYVLRRDNGWEGPDLDQVWRHQLGLVSSIEILELAAAFGGFGPPWRAACATAGLSCDLTELLDADLVHPALGPHEASFAHGLVRVAVEEYAAAAGRWTDCLRQALPWISGVPRARALATLGDPGRWQAYLDALDLALEQLDTVGAAALFEEVDGLEAADPRTARAFDLRRLELSVRCNDLPALEVLAERLRGVTADAVDDWPTLLWHLSMAAVLVPHSTFDTAEAELVAWADANGSAFWRLRALERRSDRFFHAGRNHDALEVLEAALADPDITDHPRVHCVVSANRARMRMTMGLQTPRPEVLAAAALARSVGNARTEAATLGILPGLSVLAGDLEQAVTDCRAARVALERTGDARGVGNMLATEARVLVDLGRGAEAEWPARASLALFERNTPHWAFVGHLTLGSALVAAGRRVEARQSYERAVETAKTTTYRGLVRVYLAQCLPPDAARAALRMAEEELQGNAIKDPTHAKVLDRIAEAQDAMGKQQVENIRGLLCPAVG